MAISLVETAGFQPTDFKEVLESAMKTDFRAVDIVVVMYDGEKHYRYFVGGQMSLAEILWHLRQTEDALLSGAFSHGK